MDSNTALWVTALATIALAIFTGFYVVLTFRLSKQSKLSRQDAYRPILMPIHLGRHILHAYVTSRPVSDPPRDYQEVKNVGSGPATRINAQLEGSRRDAKTGTDTALIIFDESCGYIHDLPAGEADKIITLGAYRGQPGGAKDDIEIQKDDVLTLMYDDIFGRHFRSRYKRITGQWLSLGHEEIKDRPPVIQPELGV